MNSFHPHRHQEGLFIGHPCHLIVTEIASRESHYVVDRRMDMIDEGEQQSAGESFESFLLLFICASLYSPFHHDHTQCCPFWKHTQSFCLCSLSRQLYLYSICPPNYRQHCPGTINYMAWSHRLGLGYNKLFATRILHSRKPKPFKERPLKRRRRWRRRRIIKTL